MSHNYCRTNIYITTADNVSHISYGTCLPDYGASDLPEASGVDLLCGDSLATSPSPMYLTTVSSPESLLPFPPTLHVPDASDGFARPVYAGQGREGGGAPDDGQVRESMTI